MNENAGKYEGLERLQCRRQVLEDLEKLNLLLKTEDHHHTIGHCQRCNTIIEPLISKQWFVKMKPLAKPALDAVINGDITFIPERFTRIYTGWMENIRDWCISRQLWWGHRIPVWYCQSCGQIICAKDDPAACPVCDSHNLLQEEDVLDTWFSSALWPFATLGWPEKTQNLQDFYPTSVLVTGRDIIFFWVARMIFSGLEHTGQIPFHSVNIHGLILDRQGRKMSKSLGNGIDPIDVINRFGADTLRFSMITGVTPGNDIRFNWEKVENTRNFANKLWNAARFVLMNLEGYEYTDLKAAELQLADKWLLTRLQEHKTELDRHLENYELGEAARTLYDFIWDDFCDWYIELAKPRLSKGSSPRERLIAQNVLCTTLTEILRLLHPFMPFITEEIYQNLPGASETIMLDEWPQTDTALLHPSALEEMTRIMALIKAIRNIRGEFMINPGTKINILLVSASHHFRNLISDNHPYVKAMAGVENIKIESQTASPPAQAAAAQFADSVLYIPLEGIIDTGQEINRLNKELGKITKELEQSAGKLNNDKFLAKAPPDVVNKEKTKLREAEIRKEGILKRLHLLRN
jgi:valyl-tRNA synthetase